MSFPRATHTCVELELSPEAYAEVRRKLESAGYHHAIVFNAIDMTGIAVVPESSAADQNLQLFEAVSRG